MKQARFLCLALQLGLARIVMLFFIIFCFTFAVELRAEEEPYEEPPNPADGGGLGIGPKGPRGWQYKPHEFDDRVQSRCIEKETPYRQNNKSIWKDSDGDGVDKNEKLQNKIEYLWGHMHMMEALTRQSAKVLSKEISALYDKHAAILQNQAAGTLAFNLNRFTSNIPSPPQKFSELSNKFAPPYYAEYDDKGKGKGGALSFSILNIEPPKVTFLDSESAQVTGTSFYYRKNNGKFVVQTLYIPFSVRKVSAPQVSSVDKGMERVIRNIAGDLLPEQMISTFSARKTVNSLFNQANIVRADNGIVSRPTVAQDYAFVQYANLGCRSSDEALFWSDPMVVSGYDQALGTALNITSLKGYRSVDMDNIISRGYSGKIDKENMLKKPEERVANPFKGYAAKVVPGLVAMSKEGRLKLNEPATDEQLREAMKLTKKLALLPSQNREAWMPKPTMASTQYSCRTIDDSFPFTLPQIFLAGQVSGSGTVTVPLDDLDEVNYIQRLQLAKTRLGEIQVLMDANRAGRKYVQKIIESYQIMFFGVEKFKTLLVSNAQEDDPSVNLSYVDVKKNTPLGAIPHYTMMEKQITTSVEHCRAMLSQLEHQWDDLKQDQWTIIQSVLDERRSAVNSLMGNAAIKYASYKMKKAYQK